MPDLLPGRANYRQHNTEWIEREEFGRIENLELQLSVNGQCDNASALVFKAAETISELSTFANVAPGDVLLTGTPSASALRVPPALAAPASTAALAPALEPVPQIARSPAALPKALATGSTLGFGVETKHSIW